MDHTSNSVRILFTALAVGITCAIVYFAPQWFWPIWGICMVINAVVAFMIHAFRMVGVFKTTVVICCGPVVTLSLAMVLLAILIFQKKHGRRNYPKWVED